jgi:hypothetical protein
MLRKSHTFETDGKIVPGPLRILVYFNLKNYFIDSMNDSQKQSQSFII